MTQDKTLPAGPARQQSAGGAPAPKAAGVQSPLREGLLRGMGFGLSYAVAEATVGYLPNALRMHLQAPLHAILKSLSFDIALFAVLGLIAAPLLRRKRGSLLHTLALTAMLAALSAYLSPRFMTAMLLAGVVVLVTIALHALARKLASRPALARLRIPAAVILLVAAFTLPKLAVPAPPDLPEPTSQPSAGAPNLLLIVTDTVRADHLDLYGYERETAPTLARVAKEGTVFDRAIAPGTWTIPTHASMFTGKYPSAHGAHHEGNHLAYENTTLAEVLYTNGYTTVGFNSNPFMTDSNGFTQGFERMDPSWLMMTAPMMFLSYRVAARSGLVFEDHGAREVTERFLQWHGEEWDGETPFFAFLELHRVALPLPHDAAGPARPVSGRRRDRERDAPRVGRRHRRAAFWRPGLRRRRAPRAQLI